MAQGGLALPSLTTSSPTPRSPDPREVALWHLVRLLPATPSYPAELLIAQTTDPPKVPDSSRRNSWWVRLPRR